MDNLIAIFGIEGSRKSSKTLSSTIESLKPHEFAFYAGVSYESLREKQKWLISKYGGDERKFPICILKPAPEKLKFVWSQEQPFRVPEEAKIVLVTQASVTRCNAFKLEWGAKFWQTIILDEFGFGTAMMPGLDHHCYR